MEYISSDTNIWLDFNAISRIDFPFRLPFTYIMFKEALRKEIVNPPELIDNLLQRGLIGVELAIDEFMYAEELGRKYVKLSGYDRIALSIAKIRKIPLLTGDDPLRKAAIKEQVETFGTIGLLDRLYNNEHITKVEYQYCLENFIKHTERRLPIDELQKRLDSL